MWSRRTCASTRLRRVYRRPWRPWGLTPRCGFGTRDEACRGIEYLARSSNAFSDVVSVSGSRTRGGGGGRVHRVARSRFPMLFDRRASWSRGESRTHLCLGVEYVYSAEVEGDIAEFGTMSGETAVTIAVAMRECDRLLLRRPKRLYLFDSFEGLPAIASMADRESIHVKSGVWPAGGCKMLAKDELIGRLCRKISPERLVVYDGWYKDTVLTLPSGTRFAMLHVDCDLYQSTMDALEPLFS